MVKVNVTFNYSLGSSKIPAADVSTIQNMLVSQHQSSVASDTVAVVDGSRLSSFDFPILDLLPAENR